MANRPIAPYRFIPHHQPPEAPGEDPILFAFRGREILVTHELLLPSVSEIDDHGLKAVRTQYLGRLDGRDCYSAELPTDIEGSERLRYANLHMLYGTLDEIFEATTWSQLGLHAQGRSKPVVLLDTDGYWGSLATFLDEAVAGGFVKPHNRALIDRVGSAADALAVLGERIDAVSNVT